MHVRHAAMLLPFMFAFGCSQVPPPPDDPGLQAEIAKLPELRPGQWTMHFNVVEFANDGFPDPAAEAIRRELVRLGRLRRSVCFSAEQAASMQYELWQALDESRCKLNTFAIEGESYQGTMTCKHKRGTEATVAMTGTLGAAAHRDRLFYEAKATRDPARKLRYTLEAITERTGECTAPPG